MSEDINSIVQSSISDPSKANLAFQEGEISLQAEIDKINNKTQEVKTEFVPEVSQDTEVSETNVEESYIPKDEWEEKALKIGWRPDHRGENFVEAREYVLRKPLFDRIEKQSKDLRELKDLQRSNQEYLAKIRKDAYDQALRDLEAKREEAVQEANLEQFRRLQQRDAEIRREMSQDPIVNAPIKSSVNPEVEAFGNKYSFLTNPKTADDFKMKAAATSVDNFLAEEARIEGRQIDVTEHLGRIESELKRLFPHKFSTGSASISKAPIAQSVGKSTANVKPVSNDSNFVNRLSPGQRALGEQFIKACGTTKDGKPRYTLEQYAKELAAKGRLK